MSLETAWEDARSLLKPQTQGECGVSSFWYASVLLRKCGSTKPELYDRKHKNPAVRESIRQYAKKEVLSGQGEILSATEMTKIIDHFGYACDVSNKATNDGKEGFISDCLKQNRPVLVAYQIADHGLPVATGGSAHWSLIIAEETVNYHVVNPWNPNSLTHFSKGGLLESNARVDESKPFVRYWRKEGTGASKEVKPLDHDKPANPAGWKYYDWKKDGRPEQKLKDVLISVS